MLSYNHLYFSERVKGHWTSTIASIRDQLITIVIIDFNRYWVAALFSQFGHIVKCIKKMLFVMYWVTDLTVLFMHVESTLYNTPCQKVCYNYSKNYTPLYIALSYKGGTFCRAISDFTQPLHHYFNRVPARKWELVQKYLESSLHTWNNNSKRFTDCISTGVNCRIYNHGPADGKQVIGVVIWNQGHLLRIISDSWFGPSDTSVRLAF